MALTERPVALVLRALGLGDLLTGVPALRALRRGLPDWEVVLAAPAVFGPMADLAGVCDWVHPASGLGDMGWDRPAPQLAVNLHGRGPQSHRLLAALQPGELAAFACESVGVDGPVWRPDEHEVGRWCRMVTESVGLPTDPADLRLAVPAVDAPVQDAVVVHPGAAFPARRWPVDRFTTVCRWARARGFPVAVTGSTSEVELAESVASRSGGATMLAGRTSLLELAALVSQARLVVCGDTGVAHLATAYGVPSVVLFGPVSPDAWGPPRDGPHVALWHGGPPGNPWADEPDGALLEITPTEVIEAAERLVS